MVSYVESATFKVIDKGSGPLATLRANLDALNKSAADLARKGEISARRFGDAMIANSRRARVAGAGDIARQINSAKVEGRRRIADAANVARLEQAARDREIKSARVEAARRQQVERETRKRSERELRESLETRKRLQNRAAAAMLWGNAGRLAPIPLRSEPVPGVAQAQSALDRYRDARASGDPAKRRIAEADAAFRRFEERAAQAANRAKRAEDLLAEARTRASATAKRAAETGESRDLARAERQARDLARAEGALASARRAATVAETDRAFATIRREAQIADAQRRTFADRMKSVADIPRRALAYTAAYGAIDSGRQIVGKAGAGIVEAQNQRQLTETFNFGENDKSALTKAVSAVSRDYVSQSRAQFEELGRDVLLFTKPENRTAENIQAIMDRVGATATFATLREGDSARGNEVARQLVRATENLGQADDPKKASEYLEVMTRAMLAGGKDWNARMFAQSIAQIGPQNTGALSSRFVGVMAGMMDDVRGQMAPQVRTFLENVTRSSITDKAMAAQQAAGIRDAKGEVVEGALLRANPDQWARKYLGKMVEAAAGGADKFAAMQEQDQADLVGNVMQRAGLTSSGSRAPAYFISREKELARLEADRARMKVGGDNAKSLLDRNIVLAGKSVEAKFKEAADAFTQPVQEVAAGVMTWAARQLSAVANPTETYGPPDPNKRAGFTGTATYAAGFVGAGAMALAYAKEHPGVAGHIFAAAALTRAATALTAAAGAQRLAAGVGGLGSAIGLGGALGTALRFALRASMVGLGASIAYDVSNILAKYSPPIEKGDKSGLGDRKPGPDAPKFEDGRRSAVSFEMSDEQLRAVVDGVSTGAERAAARRILAARELPAGQGYDAQGRKIVEKAADPLAGLDLSKIGEQVAGDIARNMQATVDRQIVDQYGGVVAQAAQDAAKPAAAEISSAGQSVFSQITSAFSDGAAAIAGAIRQALGGGVDVNVNVAGGAGEPGGLGGATGQMGTGGR